MAFWIPFSYRCIWDIYNAEKQSLETNEEKTLEPLLLQEH